MKVVRFGLLLGVSLGVHVLAAAAFVVPRGAHVSEGTKDPPPRTAGETFELPAPETVDVPLSNAAPSPESVGAPQPADGDAPAKPVPPARGKHLARPSHAARPSGGREAAHSADGAPGGTGESTLYGAVGDRSATDLATAFTRGFPQASSADPVWKTVPIGPAGDADVILTLDESGHIEGTRVTGSPSAALTSAIRRTMALIKNRAFTAKGKTTTIHLHATVSTDQVHDGLHGDVFAIGGSFADREGNAFFALAIGRRIDVRVRTKP